MTETRKVKAIVSWPWLGGGAVLLIMLMNQITFAADQPLGTIFYSVAERQALESARRQKADDGQTAETKKDALVTVSGLVQRQGGKSVVWVNGQPVAESQADAGAPPVELSNGRVVIDGKPVKVGETLDIVSGQRLSPLPPGAVKVKP